MANPGDFAATLKQQADIVRIIGEYVKLRKSGAQNYQGLCPFHQEKTPSFSVHATNQFFHCFGCGVSGDVFSFVQKIENITFPEAVRADRREAGRPHAEDAVRLARKKRGRQSSVADCSTSTSAPARSSRSSYASPSRRTPASTSTSRGLTPEIIAEFRIGFAPEAGFLLRDAVARPVRRRGDARVGPVLVEGKRPVGDAQVRRQNRQLTTGNRQRFVFQVSQPCDVPHHQRAGQGDRLHRPNARDGRKVRAKVSQLAGDADLFQVARAVQLDKAKQAIRQLDYAILVEGQMDCISVYAAGFKNVIASSGTAFTEPQARLLGRFSKNIVVNFDPDTAGAAAAERSLSPAGRARTFRSRCSRSRPASIPTCTSGSKGKDAYAEALHHSPRYFDYLIERARAQFPFRTPEGKVKAVNFLLPHVQRVPSRIARDELANEISHRLGIESSVLRQELRRAATARSTPACHRAGELRLYRCRTGADSRAGCARSGARSSQPARRTGPRLRCRPPGPLRAQRRSRVHVGCGTEELHQCAC